MMTIKCEVCGKSFKNDHSLATHKSRFHKDVMIIDDKNDDHPMTNDNVADDIIDDNDNKSSITDDKPDDEKNDEIIIDKAPFSKEDLERAKNDVNVPPEANEMLQMIEDMTPEDGKELYLLLIEGFGDLNGIDVDADLPELVKKADTRGKHLSYTINRFTPQIRQYVVPIMLVGGIGMDLMTIRKVGQAKKAMKKITEKKTEFIINKEDDKK